MSEPEVEGPARGADGGSHAESGHAGTGAVRVGGWGTEPPAAHPEKIMIDPSDREYHLRRVCAEFPTVISDERAARLARLLGGGSVE